MADIQWYYAHDEQQFGPISSAELKQLASAGELGPDDFVWREGMDEWAPASRVKGLFPEHRQPAPHTPLPVEDAPAAQPTEETAEPPQPPIESSLPKPARKDKSRAGLFSLIQGILWGVCVLVVLLGGVLLMVTIVRTNDAQQEAAAGVTFAALSLGAYILARAGERILQLVAARDRTPQ